MGNFWISPLIQSAERRLLSLCWVANSKVEISLLILHQCTETAKDGTWLREMSSCCCLTTASKTRQLSLNKIYIPFLCMSPTHAQQTMASIFCSSEKTHMPIRKGPRPSRIWKRGYNFMRRKKFRGRLKAFDFELRVRSGAKNFQIGKKDITHMICG